MRINMDVIYWRALVNDIKIDWEVDLSLLLLV
jgi:hypothetical protein